MTSPSVSVKIEDPVDAVASEILKNSNGLENEAKWLRRWHQWFTGLTILLGVAAPAVVTYTPPVGIEFTWKIIAIVITAFATASATIRTVLRFSERYSNSALTAIALKELWAEVQATRQQVLTETKPEYLQQALFRTAAADASPTSPQWLKDGAERCVALNADLADPIEFRRAIEAEVERGRSLMKLPEVHAPLAA